MAEVDIETDVSGTTTIKLSGVAEADLGRVLRGAWNHRLRTDVQPVAREQEWEDLDYRILLRFSGIDEFRRVMQVVEEAQRLQDQ